jgi:SagB-type dehydrogenase family enzyme
MDRDQARARFGFLCSRVEDPRRIVLRQGRFLESFHRRDADDDIVEVAHEATKLRRVDVCDVADAVTLFEQPVMLFIEYDQDREYPLQPRTRLPEPVFPDCPFSDLLRRRRSVRSFERRPLALRELGALLFGALGETGRLTADFQEGHAVEASLRSIPSGGALHPSRVFVAVLHPGDLGCGVYHYDAPEHSLEFVKPLTGPEIEALLAAFPIHPRVVDLAPAPAIFLITAKFWRSRAKYGPRGYRYCLQEAGAACQNLSLTAVALGLAHVVLGGFYDDEVHACIGIDGIDHAIVTAVAVGSPSMNLQVESRYAAL